MGLYLCHTRTAGYESGGFKMATTTKITNVLKVSEFADFADAFISCEQFSNDYNRLMDFLQTQTEAKQNKFWAFYDAKIGA